MRTDIQLVRERSFYRRSNPKLDFQFFNPYHRTCFKRFNNGGYIIPNRRNRGYAKFTRE